MAAFDEVQFPPSISAGATGGPQFLTDVAVLRSGYEQRNSVWALGRGTWDVATGVKTKANLDILIAFFRARKGKATGFRFKDWSDYYATGQVLGAGSGSSTITAASESGNVVTITTAAAHNLVAGQYVTISGVTPSAYNGVFQILAVPTSTSFTVWNTTSGLGAGSAFGSAGSFVYQLVKNYTSGPTTYTRPIYKPVQDPTPGSGNVPPATAVYLNGVAKVEGTDFTIDYTTGLVTFASVVGDSIAVSADFQFDVPARFDTDQMDIAVEALDLSLGSLGNWGKVPVVELRGSGGN